MPIFDRAILDPAIFDAPALTPKIGIFDPAIFDKAIFDTGETAELNCTLSATETPDTAHGTAAHQIDVRLAATEAQDVVRITVAHESQEPVPGKVTWPARHQEWPAQYVPEQNARLTGREAPDTARFRLKHEYTDDELVLMLMSAAWDWDEVEA